MLIKRSDSESDSFSSNNNGDERVERDTVGYNPTFIDGWTARGGDRENSSAFMKGKLFSIDNRNIHPQ